MIRRLTKNVSVIIFWLITLWIVFNLTKWWSYRNWRIPEMNKPVFIADTLDYSIPDYVEKPSLFFKITHKTVAPRTIQPVRYKPWMDSVYSAYSTVIKNGTLHIKGKRDKTSHDFTYDNIPQNVEIYGTEAGFEIIRHRFSNPIRWSGVVVGCDCGLSPNRTLVPFIETGLTVKRVSAFVYVNNKEIGIRGRVRLW